MVWESPHVGGYVTAQGYNERGVPKVALVFENDTCSISIGQFPHEGAR